MSKSKLPDKLYKYCAFNVNTLQLFTKKAYYANPASFNDPLDCNPTIKIDTDMKSLEKLCRVMFLSAYGKERADREIKNHRHNSSEYGDYKNDLKAKEIYMKRLASHVKNLICSEMNKQGVLSLGKRWNCPLMWSHYADEHRGLCIELDTKGASFRNIKAVNYRHPRSIKVSDVIEWKINGSSTAKDVILNTIFFAKAPQWDYEQEWRDINDTAGSVLAPASISAIYFGLRCDAVVKSMVLRLYAKSRQQIDFFDIYPDDDSFDLKKQPMEGIDENEPPFDSWFCTYPELELAFND
jgi:hypothetical protein